MAEELNVKVEAYEGPMELLLTLIEKNKIDIYDIPIAQLTSDYLAEIEKMENDDMEQMSEFIVMAAELIDIKSKMLLPREKDENDEEIDPREELEKRLAEYRKFKMISEKLFEMQSECGQSVFKGEDGEIMKEAKKEEPTEIGEILEGIDMDILYRIFEDVLKRKETRTDKIRSGFKSVTKAVYNIDDRISYLKDLLTLSGKISFRGIFRKTSTKAEIVVTFLAMLELIKEKDIRAVQSENFSDITIYRQEAENAVI
ncbi:MAG: segregation/condensation protein A [Firmicutes bacterium]|nr:segregation/condensation protein A [Bacillota bacterium]